MALLQAVVAVAIALAWGPEIFAAMEMTALLEMLGASLFLTAYAAGAKLTAIALGRAVHNILLPAAQMFVMRSDAPTGDKALASVYVATNAAWWVGGALVACSCVKEFIHLSV